MVEIPCICPARPDGEPRHERDQVELRERLDFRSAITIRNALAVMYVEDPEAGMAEILGVLSEQYLLHGVESWTVVDEEGKPLPVTKGTIRSALLAHFEAARLVADGADELYQEQVMRPLLGMASTSSPPTPTDASTSATSGSSTTDPMPSSPSSTGSTPTASTEPTSIRPAGASKSSPRSRSVA